MKTPRCVRTPRVIASLLFRAEACRIGRVGALALVGATSLPALAGPEGAQVVHGNVRIERDGGQTLIRASDRSIINFRSFDIGASESVRFIQPGADARVLNRIQSALPTRIDGSLSANGRVYIVNPAGVIFGQGAVVNVNGLFAAAGRMSNRDFLRGVDRATGLDGRVINMGSIHAPSVTLVGAGVSNTGSIVAPEGTVAMIAGDSVVVSRRDSNIHVRVDGASASNGAAPVQNSGRVDAPRGRVVMAAGDAMGMAINTSGGIRAGDVALVGHGSGSVVASGTIDASNQRGASNSGGTVRITGEQVGLFGAHVNADGLVQGGNVEIGGGARGSGSLRNAQVTVLDGATTLSANATDRGNAGSVVVWADHTTRSIATISATGGVNGGNGGFIETSGKVHLAVDGSRIDASATNGKGGTWLLDPRNVTITTNPTSGDGVFSIGDPNVFRPSSDSSNVFAGDISSRLSAGTSVTITTGTTGTQDGDITVTANITSNSASGTPTLRLEAANSILIDNANITSAGGTGLNVDLVADTGGSSDPDPSNGAVRIVNGSSISVNGNIRIGGGNGAFNALSTPDTAGYLTDLTASAARGTAGDPVGVLIDDSTLNAGFGTIDIRGVGRANTDAASGVRIAGSTLIEAANIVIHGAGGGSSSNDESSGVLIGSGSTLRSTEDTVALRGVGRGDENGVGVRVLGTIDATNNANINLHGVSSATGESGHGLLLDDAVLSADGGAIRLTGRGAGTVQSDGVRMINGVQVQPSGNGELIVSGSGSGTSGVSIALEGGSANFIGQVSHTGSVVLEGDRMELVQASITGSGSLTIRPTTVRSTIGLGGASGTLFLSNAELSTISGFSSVTFGSEDAGRINTNALDFTGFPADFTFHGAGLNTGGIRLDPARTLTINSSGAVTQTGRIIAERLLLLGSGSVTLLDQANDVDIIAGETTGLVKYVDFDDLTVGAIGSTTGFTSLGGSEFTARTGEFTVNEALVINNVGATIIADEINFNASVNGNSALFLIPQTTGLDITVGGSHNNGDLNLTDDDLARIDTIGFIGIGRDDGTGTLRVSDAITLSHYTNFRMGGAGGVVDITAPVRSEGGGLGLFGTLNRLGANLTGVGGDIIAQTPVVLTNNVTIDGTAGGTIPGGSNIQLRSTINADTQSNNRSLTITNGTGSVRLGDLGGNDALLSLDVTAGNTQLEDVRTLQSQTYTGPTTLSGSLRTLNPGDITFLDSLTITGNSTIQTAGDPGDDVTFRGAVTGSGDLTISTGSGRTFLFADVGARELIFNDKVVLERDVIVGGSEAVRFLDTVDSFAGETNNLTINSPLTIFASSVGAATNGALGSLSTDAAGSTTFSGGNIHTTGPVNLRDSVVLGSNTTFHAGSGLVEFGGEVQSDGSPRSLTVNSTAGTIFRSGVGSSSSLSTITVGSGPTTLTGAVSTTGAQSYAGDVLLGGDVLINASSLLIGGRTDSTDSTARDLTVAVGSGAATFTGDIGSQQPLDAIDITAGTIALRNATSRSGQRYAGQTTLNGNITSTNSGPITFAGDLLLASDSTIRSAGTSDSDDITFQGAVNSQGANRNLTIAAGAGDVQFAQALGAGGGPSALASLNASGNGVALRSVTTAGSQIYTGTTTLNGDLTITGTGSLAVGGPLTLQSNSIITLNRGDAVFGGPVNSDDTARDLTVNTSNNGVTRFVSAVGNERRLNSLTTNADGTTRIEGGQVRTVNDQVYNNPVVLGSNTTMEANDVAFALTLNSDSISTPRNLTINTGAQSSDVGETTFGGLVGGTARLGLLTTNAEGTTRIGAGIFTSRGVNFQDAALITVANVTIDGGSGPVQFRNTLNADASVTDPLVTLFSNAAGDADNPAFRFGGNIGSSRRLGGLTIGADRATTLAGSIVFSDSFDAAGRILKSGVAATDSFNVTTGAGGFVVGAGHKVVAFGSLRVTTTGNARFSDVNTLNNFEVEANSITLLSRASGAVQSPTSADFNRRRTDTGADLVVGGSVNFNRAPTVEGSGVFAYTTGSGNLDPELSNIVFRETLEPVSINSFNDPRNSDQALALDLLATGPSSTQVAPASNMRTPPVGAPPQLVPPNQIDPELAQQLADLGIDVRPRSVSEAAARLDGHAIETDMPASVGPQGLTWQVSESRISPAAARETLNAYNELIYERTTDGDGNTVLSRRADALRDLLGASWDRFAAQVDTPTGQGWRAYLDTLGTTGNADDIQARTVLVRLQGVLSGFESMGLSPSELAPVLSRVMGELRPAQIPADQFERAAKGLFTLGAR